MEDLGYYRATRIPFPFDTTLEYISPKDPYKSWVTFEDDFIGNLIHYPTEKLGTHNFRTITMW